MLAPLRAAIVAPRAANSVARRGRVLVLVVLDPNLDAPRVAQREQLEIEISGEQPTHDDRIAAGKARLRPIFMSALIAILALAPLALKIGQGSALLAPMAVAIISGLIVGAPLVLIAAPILHAAMARRVASVQQVEAAS